MNYGDRRPQSPDANSTSRQKLRSNMRQNEVDHYEAKFNVLNFSSKKQKKASRTECKRKASDIDSCFSSAKKKSTGSGGLSY